MMEYLIDWDREDLDMDPMYRQSCVGGGFTVLDLDYETCPHERTRAS